MTKRCFSCGKEFPDSKLRKFVMYGYVFLCKNCAVTCEGKLWVEGEKL